MKRLVAGTAIGLALLMSACKESGEPENVTDIEVPSGEAYQERLVELNDMARNAVFYRAIADAGGDCQEVTQSAFLGRYKNAPAWSATCRNGGEWLVLIGNDGVAQVTSRRGAEEAGVVPADGAAAGNAQQPAANVAAPAE